MSLHVIVNCSTNQISYENINDTLNIEVVKGDKLIEIHNAYKNSTQFITSNALGSTYTYLSDDTSMSKFNAEYTYINSSQYDGSPINWYTVESGGVLHTKDQINQVWIDGRSQMTNMFDKWDNLVKNVNSSSDVNYISSLSW